jgi:hypothetical protein
MPLAKTAIEFLGTGLRGISFLMRDGTRDVPCCVNIAVLHRRATATGLDEAGVFAVYRDEIEQAASAKYDRGEIGSDGRVYVTSNDFPARDSTTSQSPR